MYSSASPIGAGASVVELAISFFTLNNKFSLLRSCWMEDLILRKLFQWSCKISLWRCSWESFEAEIAGLESQICVNESITSCLWPKIPSNCLSIFFSWPVCSELVVCANVEYLERSDSVCVSREMALPLMVTKDGCELMWCGCLSGIGLFTVSSLFFPCLFIFSLSFYLFFFVFRSLYFQQRLENLVTNHTIEQR